MMEHSQPPASAVQFLPAEVRVWDLLDKALANSSLAQANGGLLGLCYQAFLVERGLGSSRELKKDFSSFMKSLINDRRDESDDNFFGFEVEDGYRPKTRNPFSEFRKLLGTQVLKLAERANVEARGLSWPIREAVVDYKKFDTVFNRTGRGKDEQAKSLERLLARVSDENSSADSVNAYAAIAAEKVVLIGLVMVFYTVEDQRLVEDALSVYEVINSRGVKLGVKSWHDPLFTMSNLARILDAGMQNPDSPQSALRRLAKFIQRLGNKREDEAEGLSKFQLNGILAEHQLTNAVWYQDHEANFRIQERNFITSLEVESEKENERSRQLLLEALDIEHPFDAVETIESCLAAKFGSTYLADLHCEMLDQPEFRLSSTAQELLALTNKESDAVKRGYLVEEALSQPLNRDDSFELRTQADQLEEFVTKVEWEILSRSVGNNNSEMPIISVGTADTAAMAVGMEATNG